MCQRTAMAVHRSLKDELQNTSIVTQSLSQEDHDILQKLLTHWEEAEVADQPRVGGDARHESQLVGLVQVLVDSVEFSDHQSNPEAVSNTRDAHSICNAAAALRICYALLKANSQECRPGSDFLLKRVTASLVALCAAHVENRQDWTTDDSCSAAKELLQVICVECRCASVRELLSGRESTCAVSKSSRLFPRGLLSHVLDHMKPKLTRNTWKKFPAAPAAVIWCVMQVEYPYLGEHFHNILPVLLLLVDDFEVDNKLRGLTCLKHLMENVNRTELHWHGRAIVIYEALRRLVYTNEPSVFSALCPCLNSILRVIESTSDAKELRGKANRRDDVFHIVLTSMEFESKIPMRRAYASQLEGMVQLMGITVLRHIKRLLNVVFSFLSVYDGPDELCRLAMLDVLHALLLGAWPRIPGHADAIVKNLLKLLVDISDDRSPAAQKARSEIIEKSTQCLATLYACCADPFQDFWVSLRKGLGHVTVDACVARALGTGTVEGQTNDKADR